jgi:2,4-dienoyl-CoA reductase-like NADH-dependent reductase (Old Yellow Enzyme family)
VSEYPHLFEPLQIGNVTVRNRIMDATERAGMAERRTTLLAQARGRTLELGADSRRRASKQSPF